MEEVLGALVTVGFIALVGWSLWWIFDDAGKRERAGCLVVILALFTWPLGHVFWLVVRPPLVRRGGARFQVDTDCGGCGTLVKAGSTHCPYCGRTPSEAG